MNPRKPIIAMIVVGVMIILALTFIPYSLTLVSQAERVVTSVLPRSSPVPENAVPPVPIPAVDVAVWYMEHGEEPEHHGVFIEAMDGKRVFASHNADTTFNPASILKLATSLIALRHLGPDYRFETRVLADGNTDDAGTLRGKLYVAGADPTFGDVAANFIARELRARGVKRVEGGVFVSPDFSFNFSESAEESAERLARALNLDQVQCKESGVAEEPAGKPLFVFRSYPLHDVLLYMNAHSNNFVAERVAAQFGDAGVVERFLVDELGLPADQVRIEKASGRGSNRMTPRGVVTMLRALAEEVEQRGLKLEDIMPVASETAGTLRRRLAASPLEGAVVGKTGTLTSEVDGGMASLGGVVYTREAGMVLFAILDQGNRIAENRELEDKLLAEVIVMQDSPHPILKAAPRQLLPSSSLHIEKQ